MRESETGIFATFGDTTLDRGKIIQIEDFHLVARDQTRCSRLNTLPVRLIVYRTILCCDIEDDLHKLCHGCICYSTELAWAVGRRTTRVSVNISLISSICSTVVVVERFILGDRIGEIIKVVTGECSKISQPLECVALFHPLGS